jgi:hypothetical protein
LQLTALSVTAAAGHPPRQPATAAEANVRYIWSLSEMTWNFNDLVKGQVTQTILSTVLGGVGYCVHRLGVEELIPELQGPKSAEIRANLPERLRFMPDFIVIEPNSGEVYLAEVKFRRSVDESFVKLIFQELEQRRKYWPEAYTILMVAESRYDRSYHQDYIRIIPPDLTEKQYNSSGSSIWERWENLPHLQHVFSRIFGDTDNQQIVDSITTVLRDLAKIQKPKKLEDDIGKKQDYF